LISTSWYIAGENSWHIVGENYWHVVGENSQYIVGRKLTTSAAVVATAGVGGK
jgi:hypothetical protein